MSDNPAHSRAVPILLVISLAWALLITAASIWLPVYTLSTSTVGVQPRVSVWVEFGILGLVPALISLVIVIAEMCLLLPRRAASTARVIAARILGLSVAAAAIVSLAFLHLEGFFFIGFAALLVPASWAAPTSFARRGQLAASAVQRR